jgi:hypothetical protein
MLAAVLGRAVIAMTAVRIGALVQAGKVTDLSDIRPPTDVMAITSLPHAPPNHPVSGFPLSVHASSSAIYINDVIETTGVVILTLYGFAASYPFQPL